MNKIKEIEGIGQVIFRKSRKARRLNLSLESQDVLRVSIPYWVSYYEAEKMLLKNAEWVRKFVRKVKKDIEKYHVDLKNVDLKKGKQYLIFKVNKLAYKYGFRYNKISIRNQRTRWGSCSHQNNISLNMKLLRMPEKIIDYVILHELIHTRVKNHSKDFWCEINKILPDAKKIDSELKKYQLNLI